MSRAPDFPRNLMPFAPLLGLAAIAGATLLTYLYDRDAPLWPRLCAGVCLGFALLGSIGFALASALGMNAASLALAGLICASPLLLLLRGDLRARFVANVREGMRVLSSTLQLSRGGRPGMYAFYAVAALVLVAAVAGKALGADDFQTYPAVEIGLGSTTLAFAALVALSGIAPMRRRPKRYPTNVDGPKRALYRAKSARRREDGEVARV